MKNLIFTVLVAFGVAMATMHFLTPKGAQTTLPEETAYERVMRTGVLRCGYATWEPYMWKDANTGELKGYDKDVTEKVAQLMDLEVEWAEETGWGTAELGLQTKRYDAVCVNVCVDARRTKAAYYSRPYTVNPQLIFVGSDSGISFEQLNSPDKTVAILPNTIFEDIANNRFPLAKRFNANDLSGNADIILAVTTGKADFAFSPYNTLKQFEKHNPGKIRVLEEPADFCLGAFMLPLGDDRLKHSVDTALTQIIASGEIENIARKYVDVSPQAWRHPIKPYAQPGL